MSSTNAFIVPSVIISPVGSLILNPFAFDLYVSRHGLHVCTHDGVPSHEPWPEPQNGEEVSGSCGVRRPLVRWSCSILTEGGLCRVGLSLSSKHPPCGMRDIVTMVRSCRSRPMRRRQSWRHWSEIGVLLLELIPRLALSPRSASPLFHPIVLGLRC